MTPRYSAAERAYTLLAGDRPILCFGAVTFREAQELTQEQWLKGDLLSHQSNEHAREEREHERLQERHEQLEHHDAGGE